MNSVQRPPVRTRRKKKDICIQIERYVTQIVHLPGDAVIRQVFPGKKKKKIRGKRQHTKIGPTILTLQL